MDLSDTITPKSDQLNADDLIAGPRVFTVKRVERKTVEGKPTFWIYYGDDARPYKPCLSMRRAFIHVWGNDDEKWPGRQFTLYCDPSVIYGGKAVGGIRLTHVSDISSESMTFMLTDKKGSRKPYTVKRLDLPADDAVDRIRSAATLAELGEVWKLLTKEQQVRHLAEKDARKEALAGQGGQS